MPKDLWTVNANRLRKYMEFAPVRDGFQHRPGASCPCGPKLETAEDPEGGPNWTRITHKPQLADYENRRDYPGEKRIAPHLSAVDLLNGDPR